jgi:hypothetical protein
MRNFVNNSKLISRNRNGSYLTPLAPTKSDGFDFIVYFVVGLLLISFLMTGCGGDKKSKGIDNLNNNGLINPNTGWGSIPGNFGLGPNSVAMGGTLNIESDSAFRRYLEGVGACWHVSANRTCNRVDNGAYLQVVLYDYRFPDSATTSGSLSVLLTGFTVSYPPLRYRKIDNNSRFEVRAFQPAGSYGYNKQLRIKFNGLPTAEGLVAEVFYDERRIGTVDLFRLNK